MWGAALVLLVAFGGAQAVVHLFAGGGVFGWVAGGGVGGGALVGGVAVGVGDESVGAGGGEVARRSKAPLLTRLSRHHVERALILGL